jgi:hypothetical protein
MPTGPTADPYAAYGGTPTGTPTSAPSDPYAAYGGTPTNTPTSEPSQQPDVMSALPPAQGIDQKISRWAQNVQHDIQYGTDLTGVGSVLKKMGAHGVYNGNSHDVGDFMASLPLGLLKMTQGSGELHDHPWQGTKDIVSGGLQASTIPGGFIAPEAGEAGAAALNEAGEMTANAGKAAASKAAAAGRAAREAYTGEAAHAQVQQELMQGIRNTLKATAGDANVHLPDNIPSIRDVPAHLAELLRQPPITAVPEAEAAATTQNELQKGIRSVIRDTGKEAGIDVAEPASIRDTALNLSDALHGKSTAIYQQLDEALGGRRFQSFSDRIRNITQALRSQTGTDPEAEGKLIERLNDEQGKLQSAIDELKEKGVDPDLIKEANATFRQHKAVETLSNNLRKSARGLRPELQEAGQEATPETLHADSLANRVNAMYDSGTLQDALGESRAQSLLRHVDRAQVTTPKPTAALRNQSDAMDEVTQAIRDSATGLHPADAKPGARATPEALDIPKLFERLHDLRDDGRLQEALGPGRARNLLQEVDAAHLRAQDIARRVNRVKTGAKIGGAAALGGGAYRAGEHILEGAYSNR